MLRPAVQQRIESGPAGGPRSGNTASQGGAFRECESSRERLRRERTLTPWHNQRSRRAEDPMPLPKHSVLLDPECECSESFPKWRCTKRKVFLQKNPLHATGSRTTRMSAKNGVVWLLEFARRMINNASVTQFRWIYKGTGLTRLVSMDRTEGNMVRS